MKTNTSENAASPRAIRVETPAALVTPAAGHTEAASPTRTTVDQFETNTALHRSLSADLQAVPVPAPRPSLAARVGSAGRTAVRATGRAAANVGIAAGYGLAKGAQVVGTVLVFAGKPVLPLVSVGGAAAAGLGYITLAGWAPVQLALLVLGGGMAASVLAIATGYALYGAGSALARSLAARTRAAEPAAEPLVRMASQDIEAERAADSRIAS